MISRRFRLMILASCLLAGSLSAQHNLAVQSPRQALVEMFSGSEENFRKHLTQEVQDKLGQLTKEDSSAGARLVRAFSLQKNENQKFDAFDFGPILFALNDSRKNSRLEAHIDSDQLNGDEDIITASLHSFQGGIEQEIPGSASLLLKLELQEGVWRLSTVTVNATIPVGDPRTLNRSWWNMQNVMGANIDGALAQAPVQAPAGTVRNDAKMTAFRAVRMVGLAENIYARQHPEVGYTCGISNLVDVGKGMENGEFYKFMDPDFADGVYNGYRFALTGCDGTPARTFRVTAEPLNGKGRAYCSDNRNNLRASDDGKAFTCLAQGKLARR